MKITRFDPSHDLILVKARVWGPGGKTPVSLAVDTGSAHTVIAASFGTLGFTAVDFPVHVFDLPEGFGIDGLVGLSFLRRFNIEIQFERGRLVAERGGRA